VAVVIAVVSVVVATLSCAISYLAVRISRRQALLAGEANDQARQIGLGQAVIHFASRYFDLMSRGPNFDDPHWTREYWSEEYLRYSSINYPEMREFFAHIHELTVNLGEEDLARSRAVQAFVRGYHETLRQRPKILSRRSTGG
jgi:hypothetical protein